MRKLFVAVAALGMLLTSCAKDESQAGGNAAVVSFNIAQPTIASRALGTADATQAYGTGYTAEDLQYAIYEAVKDAEGNYTIRENGQEPISGVVDGFFAGNELKNTLKGIRLVRGKKYIALFFAQSDYANGHWAVNWDNQQISLKDEAALKAQDESMDAFFACVPFDVDAVASAQTVDAVLKRPFAQVNVLANDAEEAQAAGLDVYQSSIVVEGVYTAMNLVTGEVSGEKTLTYDMAEVGSKYMTVNGTTYDLLSMNYLLVNARKTVDITFNYNEDATVAGNDNTVFTAQFDMVPVERNYRTNIMGSILTSDVTFEIVINPIFNEPFIDASKTPEEQLVEAAEQGGTYSLGSDVQLTSTLVVEKDFTLDLNGKTLSNPVVVRSAAPATDVIVVKEGATLTIEGDGVVEAVSGYDGYAVIAEGKVVINGGTFKAGVDADGAANAVVYARGKGEVYVNGGYFPNDANSAFVLNKKDADRATTTIEVKGGKFVNFNPANNAAETAGTNFMAKGYTVEAAEVDGKTVYTVVEIEVTPLATPVVEAAVEGKVVTLTWKAVEGAAKYAVTVGEETVEVEGTTYEFTGDWETEYAFSVKAIAADTEWHTDSAAAEVKALTEAEPEATPLAKPEVTVAVEGNVVTLTWNAVEGAKEYTVQVDDDVEEVVTETTYEFTGDWEVEYTFTVKAIAADAAVNIDSEAAQVTATTEAEPVVEPEVLAELDKDAIYIFKAATEMKGGKWYAIVYENKAATALTGNYGYIKYVEGVERVNGVSLPASCAFGFLTTEGGYTIQQYDNKYVYQTGSYDSFNVNATMPANGAVWSVAVENGAFTITNNSVNKFVQYDTQYNSYGSYATEKGKLPTLYELVEVDNTPMILGVSTSALSFGHEGDTKEFTVETYGSATLDASADVEWLNVTTSGNTVSVVAEANSGEAREAKVTVTFGEATTVVTVSQEKYTAPGDEPTISDTKGVYESMSFLFDGKTITNASTGQVQGTNAYKQEFKLNGTTYTALKLGTSSKPGSFETASVGVDGKSTLSFYAVGWKGKTVKLTVSVDGVEYGTYTLTANNGATGNPVYTALSFDDSKDYFEIDVTGISADSKITFSTDSTGCRALICGVNLF